MQAIAEARALGADVTDPERLFKQAKIALETSSYDGAVQYNRKAMVLAREAKQKYLVHGVSYILAGAKRTVQSAAQMGLDVSGSDAMLEQAHLALDKKDYDAAEQLARKAERTAILAEDKAKELLERLDRTGKRLEEISAYGVGLEEAQAAVQAARELLKDKKQADARLAMEGVEEMAFLAFRRQATKLLEESRGSIVAGKAAGLDMQDAELFLAKADERLAEGDYGKCIQCSREAVRLASEAKPLTTEGQAAQEGQAGRRGRQRPRVVAATVRVLSPGSGSQPPVIAPGGSVGHAPTVMLSQTGPAAAVASGAVTQSMMDRSPRGIPLQIPPGGGVPKDYQCPTCHGYFTVEDPRRPVLTKCPGCTNLIRLI
jgi:tetratricopeptide (TPR) repeat protein